ncbi:MAG: hypothetical protein K0R75_1040 [Paenibacillaceae bacterium]|jgi:hypothetical protein|nr:hypothetical protein [Paenibacillaceae bacterium]
MAISKKEMMEAKQGLLKLRGLMEEKRGKLKKQAGSLRKAATSGEAPKWVPEVMEEHARGFHPQKPASFLRVLRILRKHKVL